MSDSPILRRAKNNMLDRGATEMAEFAEKYLEDEPKRVKMRPDKESTEKRQNNKEKKS